MSSECKFHRNKLCYSNNKQIKSARRAQSFQICGLSLSHETTETIFTAQKSTVKTSVREILSYITGLRTVTTEADGIFFFFFLNLLLQSLKSCKNTSITLTKTKIRNSSNQGSRRNDRVGEDKHQR